MQPAADHVPMFRPRKCYQGKSYHTPAKFCTITQITFIFKYLHAIYTCSSSSGATVENHDFNQCLMYNES